MTKSRYNPRNRNERSGNAPHSWSQAFYDARPEKNKPAPCGFVANGRDVE